MDVKKTVEEATETPENDTSERPVRRKLKETTIDSAPTSFAAPDAQDSPAAETENSNDSSSSSKGRKRSHEDSDTGENENEEKNDGDSERPKKRSRESSAENNTATTTTPAETETEKSGGDGGGNEKKSTEQQQDAEGASGRIMSPKRKRSRDQLDKDFVEGNDGAGKTEEQPASEKGAREEGQRETKRHRDISQEGDSTSKPQSSIPSAFSNTSAVSPFGSLAASKPSDSKKDESPKKEPVTSSSAFAASGFSAFAGSEKSPFGALGSSNTSIFKSDPPSTEKKPEKPAPVGFAAAAGPSPFAAKAAASGVGTLGSGFASFSNAPPKIPATGGLTSFASPEGPGKIPGTSKPKPLGAAPDEEEVKEAEADPTSKGFEAEKPDERFQEQRVETGEEEEKVYFACKGKLFQFTDKMWKERGIGTLRVNVREPDESKGVSKKTARIVMRADGVLRVMLNTPVFRGMAVGDIEGNEPKNKQINLASVENGRSVPYILRTGNEEITRQLYHVIRGLQDEV